MALSPALKKKYGEHIGQDVMYPATCNDIITACNGMSEFSKQEKTWFAENLPHGTYNSADAVKRAVGV